MALDQLASGLKWALGLAGKIMFIVPVLVFWTLTLIAVALPDEIMPFLQRLSAEWHARGPGSTLIGNIAGVIGMLAIFSAFLSTPTNSRCYKQAANRLLRQHFNTPADGVVLVLRMAARGAHANGV
ncbi:hypothetical protein D3C87_1669430 [compost metagenome]